MEKSNREIEFRYDEEKSFEDILLELVIIKIVTKKR